MNTWIFQGNPDVFDLDEYLRVAKTVTWTVGQTHLAAMMRPGDRVFLWRAAGKGKDLAGIVASGWLVGEPRRQREDVLAIPLWKDPAAADAERLRVQVSIDRVARGPREVIQRAWLRGDPSLDDLRILKLASETNYLVAPTQAARLEALWRNTGNDWTYAESLAGLWAYVKTSGGQVSRLPDSPVSLVAERIGRAVSGVYNKVMNFRALDPRDERKGLDAGSQVDRAVWEQFYDPGTQQIRAVDLDAEFDRLWPPGSQAEPEPEPLEDLTSATTGRGGQGFISDPRVRRAVERRAMDLAIAHYRQSFPIVEDVSKGRPFDLLCRDGAIEVHVEVKGSTGEATEIRLTIGEVENARHPGWRTDLFVVRRIRVVPGPDAPAADGGEASVYESWAPADADLRAVVFTCKAG